MERRTASILAYQDVRVLWSGDRESLAGGFLRRRALRDTLGENDVATDDWKGVGVSTASVARALE